MTSSEPPRPRRDDAADRADALVGRQIADRYAVGSLIARGGMARVYRARDDRLQRDVALKVLAQPFAADPEHVERFLGEARTAASLSHPNLVHVYDSAPTRGCTTSSWSSSSATVRCARWSPSAGRCRRRR
jgi:serine/threonine protein kinase